MLFTKTIKIIAAFPWFLRTSTKSRRPDFVYQPALDKYLQVRLVRIIANQIRLALADEIQKALDDVSLVHFQHIERQARQRVKFKFRFFDAVTPESSPRKKSDRHDAGEKIFH